jgi:hypothetical protein
MGKELEKVLDDLEDLVCNELKKISKKPELSPAELKNATDAVCFLIKMEELQNETNYEDEEYSESRGSYARSRNARTGRYMSSSRGYSGHSIEDRIVDNLEHMMDDANSDYERNVIHRWISKVRVDND